MKTVSSIATQIGSLGVVPCSCLKDILGNGTILLPTDVKKPINHFSNDLVRAQLFEALRFGFRSLSHLVAYEALAERRQLSWSGVTLYYANYFAVLSLNRLAGRSISTLNTGSSFELSAGSTIGNFDIKRLEVNNHKLVWTSNYDLYSDFNWRDTDYDDTIVKVRSDPYRHYERKTREYMNYHPGSYSEIFMSSAMSSNLSRRFYTDKPNVVWSLPLDEEARKIALLESAACARQDIIFSIFAEVYASLQPESRLVFNGYATQFSKRVASYPPYSVKLKAMLYNFLIPLMTK